MYSRLLVLGKGVSLYKIGTPEDKFYYIVKGEVLLVNEGQTSILKATEMLGFNLDKNSIRKDIAMAKSAEVEVLEFDTTIYKKILTHQQIGDHEEKINFLRRHLPHFRNIPRH